MTESNLRSLLARFDLDGTPEQICPFGEGHINQTYRVKMEDGEEYILQSINPSVFRNTEGLMHNIADVTAYLRRYLQAYGGDPDRQTLTLIPTREGKTHLYDERGLPWRVYRFIRNTFSYQTVEKAEDFYFSAKAFASFAAMLSQYPADRLVQTIPAFHNTKVRYYNLIKAIRADRMGRAASVQAEIDFALDRIEQAGAIVDALEDGRIPLRVTHNDTKLNNVLIDRESGRAICVCDLDTIMPGSILYDFGDAIRFGTNPAAEDERDLSLVRCDLALFEAYVKGTMEVLGGELNETEIAYLPLGARTMTLECGVRFLTDYLEGDTYFRIHREGHNLDRCRTQFALLADMERKEGEMDAIVAKYR